MKHLIFHKSLSPRQQIVFDRVRDGFTNRQIAEELGISRRTVEIHREKMRKKLGHIPRIRPVFSQPIKFVYPEYEWDGELLRPVKHA